MNVAEARAILLANIMTADSTVRPEEMDTGRFLTLRDAKHRNMSNGEGQANWIEASQSADLATLALNVLRRLPERERVAIIDDLWTMAACDAEVHSDETRLVLEFSAKLGISSADSKAPCLNSPHP